MINIEKIEVAIPVFLIFFVTAAIHISYYTKKMGLAN